MTRITRDGMLLQIAEVVAQRGTCLRKQVGAVIARDGRVLSIGYNGPPSGLDHCAEFGCDVSRPCERAVHAEANAIAFAARVGISVQGAALFCTTGPCRQCAELIINSGIGRVIYLESYRDNSGVDLLWHANIPHARA